MGDRKGVAPRGNLTFEQGLPHPLGATVDAGGVNFSVFSHHATGVKLLLFGGHDQTQPVEVVRLDPAVNRTFHFWHVYVRGAKPGLHYAYRVSGPAEPWNGHRFDPDKVLIDPYA